MIRKNRYVWKAGNKWKDKNQCRKKHTSSTKRDIAEQAIVKLCIIRLTHNIIMTIWHTKGLGTRKSKVMHTDQLWKWIGGKNKFSTNPSFLLKHFDNAIQACLFLLSSRF